MEKEKNLEGFLDSIKSNLSRGRVSKYMKKLMRSHIDNEVRDNYAHLEHLIENGFIISVIKEISEKKKEDIRKEVTSILNYNYNRFLALSKLEDYGFKITQIFKDWANEKNINRKDIVEECIKSKCKKCYIMFEKKDGVKKICFYINKYDYDYAKYLGCKEEPEKDEYEVR